VRDVIRISEDVFSKASVLRVTSESASAHTVSQAAKQCSQCPHAIPTNQSPFWLSASKPDTTSKSSSSIPLWRVRWKSSRRFSSSSSIFLFARSMAANRLAFSLARDSAHARKSEINRYSRTRARSAVGIPDTTSGKVWAGHGTCTNPAPHAMELRDAP
jgi:hypothetical protein